MAMSIGPWGGNGGDIWDDGVHTGIRQIILTYGDVINSINIEYDNNGSSVWLKHGTTIGTKTEKIQFAYPEEILHSISGHYDQYVRSLTFTTSVSRYGPYGVERDTNFSFPIVEGKIVGFHGRSGWYLDCIGVYLSNLHNPEIMEAMSVGPWGGNGGNMWNDGVYTGIHQITLTYGDVINSIEIEYDNNGNSILLKHGTTTGKETGKIEFDYPKEILTSVSGHYDHYVRSLTFNSNLKKYGPYGVEHGMHFSFPIVKGKVVGFHGRSGWYLDCIGVYLSYLHNLESMKPMSIGPWGGNGGVIWDDGVHIGIRQIVLTYGDVINSFNIEYDNNGSSVWLKHGTTTGTKTEKIQFDYPQEILISISGDYDKYVRSLTFESNLKKYGPYGVQQGTHFSLPIVKGKIVGFYGRSGWYLDCIGIYASNLHGLESNLAISIGPWGGQGGNLWDDGVHQGIHKITLVQGDVIDSITIEYESDGKHVSFKHGGNGGNKIDTIELNYPEETLTSISGYYDNYMRSLTFESNLKKYGPYGVEQGTYFSFPIIKGKIVSFHGRSGWYLDSIGIYLSNLKVAEYESHGVNYAQAESSRHNDDA